MLYQLPTFTCPAAESKTTQQNWDLAFLNREEFKQKYEVTDREYEFLASGE